MRVWKILMYREVRYCMYILYCYSIGPNERLFNGLSCRSGLQWNIFRILQLLNEGTEGGLCAHFNVTKKKCRKANRKK